MNILFLSVGNVSNIEVKGIYTDLLRKFREEGHEIYILHPLEKKSKKPTEYIYLNGVHFLRVKIGDITNVNNFKKGISTLGIERLFIKAIRKYLSEVNFDLVLYSTPPITFAKVVHFIKKRDNAKSYLLLKDIFPQNAVDLKLFNQKNLLYKFFRKKEMKLYSQSDFIGCMSQANKDFILSQNDHITPEKVEICPNSIEPIKISCSEKEVAEIREVYRIPIDKTVFVYGGNLGKPQGIEFLIQCLEANRNNDKVYFVVAGGGTEFNKLKKYFEKYKPFNAQLFEKLPKHEYELLANSCDVGLIFLDNRFTIPNFPSRLLSYMQASMPVLAATDLNTDIGHVIEKGEFGYWCESRDVKDFNNQLEKFYDEKLRRKMGQNAREYLEENYTSKHSYQIIMNHFK